jgi:hypothetical protein
LRQFVESTAIERQVHELFIADLLPQGGGLGVKRHRRRRDFDLGVGRADSQLEIHPVVLPHQ